MSSSRSGTVSPDQLGHLGALAHDVELDPPVAHQAAVAQPVQADGHPVRADGVVAGLAGLDDGERLVRVAVADGEVGPQGVDAGRLQPLRGPLGELAAAGLLQVGQEVGQLGVAPLVLAEVPLEALAEGVLAHPGHQLLQRRGALEVGDAVEVEPDGVGVDDVGGDGVGGRQLVLGHGAGLGAGGEADPGVGEAGGLGQGVGGHVGGEALVEPQVVPPPHGDQVAEPHVGHLVQEGVGPALVGGLGLAGAEHHVLVEGDAARVLHGAEVELGHEELVVLGERVRVVELVLEEVEALAGEGEQLVGVEVLGQRLPAVDAQVDLAVDVADHVVRAGDHGDQVGGDDLGGGEAPDPALAWWTGCC